MSHAHARDEYRRDQYRGDQYRGDQDRGDKDRGDQDPDDRDPDDRRRRTGAGVTPRLTMDWQRADRAATLREHSARFGPLRANAARRGNRDLLDQIAAAGLTGRGGASFPTAKKMRAVAAGRGPAVVVANGMESEPASEKDQALLARAPHLVLDGISVAATAVGAAEAHLCLSRTRGWLVDSVLAAIAEREQAGADRIGVAVHELPHHYVSSEETALVHWLNGGEAKPTSTPPRPFERGVGKRPTLVDNVETLAHVALIARYGAAWFREAGTGGGAGTMLTTVAGAVSRPGVYEVEAGTSVGDVLELAGLRERSEAVLIGGYFGTWHDLEVIADLPFTAAGLRPAGGSPGAGVLFALPAGTCGLAEAARIMRYLASQGAQQCGPCIFGLPAIADDLAQLAAGRPEGDPLSRMQRRFGVISGRGACRHPDGAVRMAASAIRTFGADAHAHARRRPCLAAHRGRQQTALLPVPRPFAEGDWR
ncbi:MAG TPA: NADH-ubiquinone oxidoreductase-F iron-sulfur binding region domain-containing protein [Streptosporangiaceae bacterium]|nr:NADH-ubiquinone oxidoreductase-F iron-sulfur binding region domain-containing protein [Streptosporangiaceae bacterium]